MSLALMIDLFSMRNVTRTTTYHISYPSLQDSPDRNNYIHPSLLRSAACIPSREVSDEVDRPTLLGCQQHLWQRQRNS